MRDNDRPSSEDPGCLAEAAAWRVRLTEDGSRSGEFEQWLAEDPAHRAAWRSIDAHWTLLGEQASTPELLELREAALGHARGVRGSRLWRSAMPARVTVARGAAALVLLAFLASAVWWLRQGAPDVYSTQAGERRSITLDDGSRLYLDAKSEVRVSYTPGARDCELVRGQARFGVSADPARPFTVRASGQLIRALGTDFNVDLFHSTLAVTLIRGHVRVVPDSGAASSAGQALEPGQQLVLEAGVAPVLRSASAEGATAWERGQFVFDNDTLGSAVARFNRYNDPQLRLMSDELQRLRISGVFQMDDPHGFVTTAAAYFQLDATPAKDGGIEIRPRTTL